MMVPRIAGRGPRPTVAPVANCRHPESAADALFVARDYITGDEFSIVACRRCALVRTKPVPASGDRYYPPSYYGGTGRYVFPVDFLLHRLQATRSRRIHRLNGNRPGRMLDVGCGRGLLLDELRRLGWTVTGTELTDTAARYAREELGLDVKVGDLRTLSFGQESFDAIVLWHVLEHIEVPSSLLWEVHRLLRPGGFLVVAVPNFSSAEARLFRQHWFHLDVPRHLCHFAVDTLCRLLGELGLERERTMYFSPEYDYFSFVQSALNRLGARQNLLYELLRAAPAKLLQPGSQRRDKFNVLANAMLAPALGLVAMAWVPVAARMRQGATVTVVARKS